MGCLTCTETFGSGAPTVTRSHITPNRPAAIPKARVTVLTEFFEEVRGSTPNGSSGFRFGGSYLRRCAMQMWGFAYLGRNLINEGLAAEAGRSKCKLDFDIRGPST